MNASRLLTHLPLALLLSLTACESNQQVASLTPVVGANNPGKIEETGTIIPPPATIANQNSNFSKYSPGPCGEHLTPPDHPCMQRCVTRKGKKQPLCKTDCAKQIKPTDNHCQANTFENTDKNKKRVIQSLAIRQKQ